MYLKILIYIIINVNTFNRILQVKRIELSNSANKLKNGLFKMNDTSEKVAGMTVELERATGTVSKYTEECDKFLLVILNNTSIADQQKIEVDETSKRIEEEKIVCQTLYSLAVTDLEKAMPALNEAMEV